MGQGNSFDEKMKRRWAKERSDAGFLSDREADRIIDEIHGLMNPFGDLQELLEGSSARKHANGYFSHYYELDNIRPVDLRKYGSLRAAVSKGRDEISGLYLTLILAQNPRIKEWADYNRKQREEIKEQADGFLKDRQAIVLDVVKEEIKKGKDHDLEEKINLGKTYNPLFNPAKPIPQYDIIVAGNIIEMIDNYPSYLFEHELRKDPVIYLLKKNPLDKEEQERVELDEDYISVAVELSKCYFNEINKGRDPDNEEASEEDKEKLDEARKFLDAVRSSAPDEWDEREMHEYNMLALEISLIPEFQNTFKNHLDRVKKTLAQGGFVQQLRAYSSSSSILIYRTNERLTVEEEKRWESNDDTNKVIEALSSSFIRIASYKGQGARYLAFAHKHL
jgi:hypothetical protein